MVSPAIDLSTAINPKLEFYEDAVDWNAGYHHYIMVSTTSQTDPGAFVAVADWTPGNHSIPGFAGEPTIVSLLDFVGESTVYIAWRYRGLASHSDTWYVDDVRVFMPNDHDVMAVGTVPDGVQLPGGTVITPQGIVENNGMNTESFDVNMTIAENGVEVYNDNIPVANLPPGNQVTLDFDDLTLASGAFYSLTVTTDLTGDEDPSNDSYVGTIDTYDIPHVPIGMLFTNSGCGPCAQPNSMLDAYMPGQGNDVALVRIHVSWPNPGDWMYQANTAQSGWLVTDYGVTGVPNFFLDRFWDLGYTGSLMIDAFEEGKTWKSPMSIDLAWNNDLDQLTVTVHLTAALPPGDHDLRLFCAITEDDILHSGGNGEPIHNQAMRYIYPDVQNGVSVPNVLGNHSFVVDCDLSNLDNPYWDWVYENLRATVYVQDQSIERIWQSATEFLTVLEDASSAEGPESFPFELGANFPNPFNPKTTIRYSLDAAGPVSLRIFNSAGRLVRTLEEGIAIAGEHQVVWNGLDDAGHSVASGVYHYQLDANERSVTRKMLLLK